MKLPEPTINNDFSIFIQLLVITECITNIFTQYVIIVMFRFYAKLYQIGCICNDCNKKVCKCANLMLFNSKYKNDSLNIARTE